MVDRQFKTDSVLSHEAGVYTCKELSEDVFNFIDDCMSSLKVSVLLKYKSRVSAE